ncbi:MAG: cupin domain-containing protein [Desulfobacterales bacterium]|jgi:quercetin dioxygenase-like cupin family protein
MFQKQGDGTERRLLDGVYLKVRAHGEKTLMGEFRLQKGAVVPAHGHPHEQTGLLLSGRLRFTVDGEPIEAGPGDSWCIAGGVLHSAEALEDSVAVEVFSPVREDYL